ncbi:hypothetical protein [Rubrolithibacter danxiaensis]|uniref:hypothetical protein n=1 Tax=Rubrolithibacter danxiaensis TaxID=3390805 RepID=UPI003BF77BE2
MKRLFLAAAVTLTSLCAVAQNKIDEGSISYTVEWKLPPQAPAQMASMLPTEMTVYFKGDSSATTSKTSMSSTKSIMNSKTEYQRLLLDIPMMNKKFSIIFTPADMEQMEDQKPDFELTVGTETKAIAGYNAQKYSVKEKRSGQTFDGWFSKDADIVPNSLTQFFDKSYGLPLEFVTFHNGMGLKATVKEIKKEAVPAGTFGGSKDYQEITFDELKGMMGGAGRQ